MVSETSGDRATSHTYSTLHAPARCPVPLSWLQTWLHPGAIQDSIHAKLRQLLRRSAARRCARSHGPRHLAPHFGLRWHAPSTVLSDRLAPAATKRAAEPCSSVRRLPRFACSGYCATSGPRNCGAQRAGGMLEGLTSSHLTGRDGAAGSPGLLRETLEGQRARLRHASTEV